MRVRRVLEVHSELRKCSRCGAEYIFRVMEDGEQVNQKCPRCRGRVATTLKVYPRRSRP